MKTVKNNQKKTDSVKVCIRMRPLLMHEDSEFWKIDEMQNRIFTANAEENHSDLLTTYSKSLANQTNKDLKRALIDSLFSPQSFTFDKTYSMGINSQTIYKEMCRDLTKSVIKGYNCSIFMYGQTTSGKTFTMLGSPNSPGILPCTLRDIFNMIQKEPNSSSFSVYCSYVEIYNENIHDLLTDANYLKLIDDNKYGVVVAGAKRVKINTFEDGIGIKDYGEENRKYRETLFNEYSSRSHTIFQIFIESMDITINEENKEYATSRFSCLNLVDLAGSERINEYDPKAEGSGETGYINKSLFVLANVINRLAQSGDSKNHIPYRDSKLTRLLSQALGGNSLTTIICTVSPAALNYYQTLSTLRFAMRAKNVKLKPSANEYLDDKAKLEYYKNEIKKLKNELKSKNNNDITNDSGRRNVSQFDSNNADLQKILHENIILSSELNKMKELYLSEKEKNVDMERQLSKAKLYSNSYHINQNDNIININNTNNNIPQDNYTNNSNNKDSFFIDDLIIQLSPNLNDVNVNQLNNISNSSQWLEKTNKISNEYKNQLYNLQNQYSTKVKILHNEIFNSNSNNNINSNNSNINSNNNINILRSTGIDKKKNESNLSTKNKDINIEQNKDFLFVNYQGTALNSKDKTKVDYNNNNNNNNENTLKRNTNMQLIPIKERSSVSFHKSNISELDDIIKKIKEGNIFESVSLTYIPKTYDNFEDNVQELKQNYEHNLDELEKTMDYYKSYIENYYRKKIQQTRNTNMETVELIEGNLPIMQITDEHNEMLKKLRDLNDTKIKELETAFFNILKEITAKRMDDISK